MPDKHDIEDLETKLAEQQEINARLHKEVMEYIKVEKVMIAAGLVSEDKFLEAHNIVRSWS